MPLTMTNDEYDALGDDDYVYIQFGVSRSYIGRKRKADFELSRKDTGVLSARVADLWTCIYKNGSGIENKYPVYLGRQRNISKLMTNEQFVIWLLSSEQR